MNNKKVIVSTWCTDDYAEFIGIKNLKNSLKYFHPEVEHDIVDSSATENIKQQLPWLQARWMIAPTCIHKTNDCDMVVHLDGDSLITGELDELFESDADVVGVRNNNTLNQAGAHRPISIPMSTGGMDGANISNIPFEQFLNGGLVGVQSKEFLQDWIRLNERVHQNVHFTDAVGTVRTYDEQDTLNLIFHGGKYTTQIVDQVGSGVSYGQSNAWGTGDNHWESWRQLYIKDDRLWINDPVDSTPMKVKVLHQAGGALGTALSRQFGSFENWLKYTVPDEVAEYIEHIINKK